MRTIVLDEADVMLKLGFKEDIEKVSEIYFIAGHKHFLDFGHSKKAVQKRCLNLSLFCNHSEMGERCGAVSHEEKFKDC